ncbi:MAG TPA: RsmB/NOP family class I SAM-dependent RNA methyltransferase, partial [Anaeromyxobacter sp.]|nr:RsmB/NOP family class I SAM-dependent RNA methyltransferase [Anaeromyxobacter sp.]
MRSAAEERLRSIPWERLRGVAPLLDGPLAEALAGADAADVLARALRGLPGLDAPGRAAVAEAVLGVALWRRRLRA